MFLANNRIYLLFRFSLMIWMLFSLLFYIYFLFGNIDLTPLQAVQANQNYFVSVS